MNTRRTSPGTAPMIRKPTRDGSGDSSRGTRLAAFLPATLGLGCGGIPVTMAEDNPRPPLADGAALSGEGLEQRKREMQRAMRDMVHIGATMESLRLHAGSDDDLFRDYIDRYLEEQVDPLLSSSTASEDPGLAALGASLHFVKGDLLVEMSERYRVWGVIDEIDDRFEGRDSLIVDYPIGSQTTLRDALEYLRERSRGAHTGRWGIPTPQS